MRISDWSSDVCSSDLLRVHHLAIGNAKLRTQGNFRVGLFSCVDPQVIDRAHRTEMASRRLMLGQLALKHHKRLFHDLAQQRLVARLRLVIFELGLEQRLPTLLLLATWPERRRVRHYGGLLDRKSTRLNSSH